MTRVLRLIGYWDGPAAPEGLPDVCGFVSPGADITTQRTIAAYLRSGTVFVTAAGASVCRLCGAANGSAEQTDGEHFVWPEGLAHYVETHGVRLPDEVAAVAARGTSPAVDLASFTPALLETGELSIDRDWWRGRTGSPGPGAGHLHGCRRRSGSVAAWNLPTTADIYVDGLPPDAVAILARIRALLGTPWPFSSLRGMLASQPFRAATGNPSQLYHALRSAPELQPYLFYGTAGDLNHVWSDTS